MKKQLQVIVITAFIAFLPAFAIQITGTVKGRVVPYNTALRAWAVSDKDTATGVIQNGAFEIKRLKEGKYQLIVEGLKPYKVTTRPDAMVNSGAITDVGDIILDQ